MRVGAHARIRTGDFFLTKQVLYRLRRKQVPAHHFHTASVTLAGLTYTTRKGAFYLLWRASSAPAVVPVPASW